MDSEWWLTLRGGTGFLPPGRFRPEAAHLSRVSADGGGGCRVIRSQVESWPPPTLGCTAHASTRRKNLKMQTPPPPASGWTPLAERWLHRSGTGGRFSDALRPAAATTDHSRDVLVSRAVLSLCHPLRLRALPSVRNSGTPPRPQTSEQAPGQRPREAGRGRRAGRAGAAAQAARPAPFTLLPELQLVLFPPPHSTPRSPV